MSQTEDLDYIIGEIQAVFFENPTNYYKVMQISVEETNTMYSEKKIVVTGNFVSVQEGTAYQFNGHLVEHAKYGLQFQVQSVEPVKITSKNGLVRYFSSSQFPGIGKTLASRIVEVLGSQAIYVILTEPERLKEVKGLSKKLRTMLVELIQEDQGSQRVIMQLSEWGFSSSLAARIYEKYRDQAVDVIEENPYQLVREIEGFGFKRADQLAAKMDLAYDSPKRLAGALNYCLYEICYRSGNTYVEADQLVQVATDQVNLGLYQDRVPAQAVQDTLDQMLEEGLLICPEGSTRVALPHLFLQEETIARRLTDMIASPLGQDLAHEAIDRAIDQVEIEWNLKYGHAQKQAIKEALQSKFYVLTGGPGTGKTTVLKGIVAVYAQLKNLSLAEEDYLEDSFPIALAAPTGRAAKRMSEVIGLPASTLHRLLGLTKDESDEGVEGIGQMLEADLLIVDELSMVDTWLAYQLLESIPPYMQVIFVGDEDQLPSVGPGQVLADILRAQVAPARELDEIFRQSDDSSITELAHQIKQGLLSPDLTRQHADRSFIKAQSAQIAEIVAQIAERAVAKDYLLCDVQVLAPMYKGEAGIDHINEVLQERLNPNPDNQRREVVYFEKIFRVGDKVLQLQNQAEKNVFNGDMGEIVAIFFAKETASKADEIVVAFDEVEVTYTRTDWKQLTLAYCTSIHKAQGSEFPIVILPLVHQHQRMLKRNLVYTAITRAKQSLIMCGEEAAFAHAIQHQGASRQTQLYDFLLIRAGKESPANQKEAIASELKQPPREAASKAETPDLDQGPKRLTPDLVASQAIDPMIGMDGLSPYDF